MPCERCDGGYWQCSAGGDPCELANEPIEVQEHCLNVWIRKTGGGKCRMQVQKNSPGGNWESAGAMCFRFTLYESAKTGECFVKVEDLQKTKKKKKKNKKKNDKKGKKKAKKK